ncbi:ISAzo13-like element transposase-related protein [Candidatus Uabimicrobium amorphum]|uniref:ISAzo13 family transposase n=1 Tax=Uabimicrobium amorphum TaxID=2596890 RepID=A0A5S9IK88_UABAM|nr:hypothetical protein [Candidatus Uabimicrobium amorphum]BBM83419.1 hypothetical protein UABAM_01771 [Candidatus Uabimicrobium amorphum]
MTQDIQNKIKEKFDAISPFLDEKSTRLWCAAEARAYGYGGITIVSNATRVSRTTIRRGIEELDKTPNENASKIRQTGGGRKKISITDLTIMADLQNVIKNNEDDALYWTDKSVQQITNILTYKGHRISSRTVNRMLKNMGYFVQRKEQNFPEQCKYINKRMIEVQKQALAMVYIEIDQKKYKTKNKKKLESNSKNLLEKNLITEKTYFVVDSLYTWAERKTFNEKPSLEIITHAHYVNNKKYWLQALQNFANQYNTKLYIHLIGSGIKKWQLLMDKMHFLYPEKDNGQKKQKMTTVYFSARQKSQSTTTVIRDRHQVSYVETKKNIQRDSVLGNWNYVVKPM